MYLKSIHIKNIRGIEDFKMEFPEGKEAGWHVLLGANGSGKTTVLRAIALSMIGPTEFLRLDPNWEHWRKVNAAGESGIDFEYWLNKENGATSDFGKTIAKGILRLLRDRESITLVDNSANEAKSALNEHLWNQNEHYFSAGIGAFRRFTGGNQALDRYYRPNLVVGCHLTLFKEDAALSGPLDWLKDQLARTTTQQNGEAARARLILDGVKHFINDGELLPRGYLLSEITADGLFFTDPTGSLIHLYNLSEGIISALSLGLELLRLLATNFEPEDVFIDYEFEREQSNNNDSEGNGVIHAFIPQGGIVLIDEVDAHLHPDWQARIGTWFRKVFPNIQFIVATHSPLVVRAAGDDSQIWWLPAAGSAEEPRLIENGERNRLVYGDVLDAYGTEVFGKQDERSAKGKELMHELAQLGTSLIFGKLDEKGIARMEELKSMLSL